MIALPLRSLLYVREKDVPSLEEKYGWKFRTKLELAVHLVTWFVKSVRSLGVECKIWLVTDGAYAGRPVLKPLTDLGVVVFSRLRKDACLFDLPPAPSPVSESHTASMDFIASASQNVSLLRTDGNR